MKHTQPGLFLHTGPPIHFLAVFRVDEEHVGQMRYDLTAQQATELGATLLRLSGATEARALDRTEHIETAVALHAGVN
jgi:hypothetical protein